jgi:hypothetical protein
VPRTYRCPLNLILQIVFHLIDAELTYAMQVFSIESPFQGNNSNDDWSGITAREERKKRQNRLNQRARRIRKAKESEASLKLQPFRVQRWRVAASLQKEPLTTTSPPPATDDANFHNPDTSKAVKSVPPIATAQKRQLQELEKVKNEAALYLKVHLHLNRNHLSHLVNLATDPSAGFKPHFWWSSPLLFPLSPDHILLHLIHFNVFRALTSNKSLLAGRTLLTKPTDQGPKPLLPNFKDFCAGVTLLHPLDDKPVPASLVPTPLQMTMPHSSWLNMFPFPRLRDNLIAWEGIFDAVDFCNDIFGDIYTNSGSSSPASTLASVASKDDVDEDDVAVGRRGLIVWGEPWDPEGWEVTAVFMEKWAWLLTGCDDLIASTNRWRAKRDEKPLCWHGHTE